MTTQPSRRGRGRPPHPDILTPREWQALDLLREGLTNEQIAQRLDISFATAKYHVAEIISKLGVQTREEAAAWQPPTATESTRWKRMFAPLTAAFRRLGPFSVAKAGIVSSALVALAGLGVLIAVLSGGGEETQSASAQPIASFSRRPTRIGSLTATATPTPNPSPTAVPVIEAQPVGVLQTPNADPFSWEQPSADYRWRGGLYLWSSSREELAFISPHVGGRSWPQNWAQRSFDWSPDGQQLAYLTYQEDLRSYSLMRVNIADGTRSTFSIEPLTAASEIAWSPDGRYVAVTGDHYGPNLGDGYSGVLLIDLVDSTSQLIIGQAGQDYSPRGSPTWSADSRRIAVGIVNAQSGIRKIAVLDLNGLILQEIADGNLPAWSPDGELLAYEVPGRGLFVVPADGSGEPINIANGYHAVWSPDGGRIAYQGTDSYTYVIDRNGGVPQQIALGQTPAWSADGTQIFFTRDGNLFVTNFDAGPERQLTFSVLPFVADPLPGTNSDLTGFVWSPGAPWTIYTANVDGSDEQELFPGRRPRWSPDGGQLAFASGFYNLGVSGSMYVMRPDGMQISAVGPFFFTDSGGGCSLSFRWGTDSQHFAYSPTHSQLSIVSIAGQTVHTGPDPCVDLSPDFGRAAYLDASSPSCSVSVVSLQSLGGVSPPLNPPKVPIWSPDGTRIAFQCGETIAVTDANGANQRTLLTLPAPYSTFYLTWSPDSRRLGYVSGKDLYVVDVDGAGSPVRMPKSGFEEDSIDAFDWSPDGTLIAFTVIRASGDSGNCNHSIHVASADGSGQPSHVTCGDDPDWSPDGTRIAFTR